jgi:DNA-binding beta-propeller fold protein YncE
MMVHPANHPFIAQPYGSARTLLLLALALTGVAGLASFLLIGVKAGAESNGAGPSPYLSNDKFAPAWLIVGKKGTELGEFQQPRGITGMADGSFVVVDRAARVQHFAADGKPLGVFCMKERDLGNPKGLVGLPNGNLLICDTHYGRLLEMNLQGDVLKRWAGTGYEPGQVIHPLSAAVDPVRKCAYVVNYGDYSDQVLKFGLDGNYIKRWGAFGSEAGQFQRPSGVAVDSEGSVYVADSCNHRVQKFDPDGKLLAMFGEMGVAPGQLRYPYDIACGPGDLLYVVEFNNHRVSVFTKDGAFVRALGGPGLRGGEFCNPWSLAIDVKGRLMVSDTANFRVEILDLNRELKQPAAAAKPVHVAAATGTAGPAASGAQR